PKLQAYPPIFSLTPKASGSTRLQSCEDKVFNSQCDSENQCQNRGNGKGKLSSCHNVILGNRKGCIGFQKGVKGQFALICSYLNRKLLFLN
ncbi:MAG: hypothetical protein E6109_17505, partial [Ruminococcus sp.]|nr:hypothetical protein [Ruminococcus sp.]